MITLSAEQLATILARALPGERLRETRALPGGRYALALAGGERLQVQLYDTAKAAESAAAALRLLREEIDLPVPQLRASDPQGDTVGQAYLLLSELRGEPLDQALGALDDEALYKLGRALGTALSRVHRLVCEQYGALAGAGPAAADERGYALARLAHDLRHCGELGLLDRRSADELTGWFEHEFTPLGRQPALLHGGLRPSQVLVRAGEVGGWRITGLLGWGQALGWSPAWDHAAWLDASDAPRLFSLRVGYGNAYDELTNRAYEQVRERVLAPYRMLLMLERMQAAHAAGDIAECERRRGMLRGLMQIVDA